MYLTLPQKMPSAEDRRLVLNIEVCDSSRQRGATGLTIGKGRGFEGRSRDRLAGEKPGVCSR